MSVIQQEIERIVASIVVPPPMFTIIKSRTTLEIKKVDRLHTDIESPIRQSVINSVHLVWNKEALQFDMSLDNGCLTSVRVKILNDINAYITRYHHSRNPKLTSLYRWYNQTMKTHKFDTYVGLEDMLYETWKYMQDSKADSKTRANVFGILEVIKQKFEAKGLKKK